MASSLSGGSTRPQVMADVGSPLSHQSADLLGYHTSPITPHRRAGAIERSMPGASGRWWPVVGGARTRRKGLRPDKPRHPHLGHADGWGALAGLAGPGLRVGEHSEPGEWTCHTQTRPEFELAVQLPVVVELNLAPSGALGALDP
jgi:hypothetical protein